MGKPKYTGKGTWYWFKNRTQVLEKKVKELEQIISQLEQEIKSLKEAKPQGEELFNLPSNFGKFRFIN